MVAALHLGLGLLHFAFMILAAHTTQESRFEERYKDVTATPATPSMCDARTINHITHTLPQLCLARSWQNASLHLTDSPAPLTPTPSEYTHARAEDPGDPTSVIFASATNSSIDVDATASTSIGMLAVPEAETLATDKATAAEQDVHATASEVAPGIVHEGDTMGSSYMSFEDWKEKMLRQTGQDPQALRSRKVVGIQGERRIPPQVGDYGLGEEDEISLDFGDYLDQAGRSSHQANEGTWSDDMGDALLYEGDKAPLHRSKDAGKTCKERFSYSSFDAGATILKTGRSTKNAKAILIENKDSYMLLECGADSKYVIVELSDDILIDTVVLANFEFFSSMIRRFRVSVSDRYPVKMDKWRDIGTYEARNSRDIQAFLVENPQIWAKYVRIEFLTHYGNEYYCPVSLLRIHGSRILDSLKDMEDGRGEEISIGEEETEIGEDPNDVATPKVEPSHANPRSVSPVPELDYSPWIFSPLVLVNGICQSTPTQADNLSRTDHRSKAHHNSPPSTEVNNDLNGDTTEALGGKSQSTLENLDHGPNSKTSASVVADTAPGLDATKTLEPKTASSTSNSTRPPDSVSPTTKASASTSSSQKPRGSATGGASAAAPTVQEGFFHAITKRLHHAETNLTLTMQYLEDHSKFVQDSLEKAEQMQLAKVTAFLHSLNQTVLAELREMRDQYDQIWQSTVIALETQKDQSDRDIVALSSRLNLLADEVVFQKRMAIVQAVLLLCCLFLVIFSRGVPIPYLAPLLDQAGTNMPGALPSHDHLRPRPLFTTKSRPDDGHHAQGDGWPLDPRLVRPQSISTLKGRPRSIETNVEDDPSMPPNGSDAGSSSVIFGPSCPTPPFKPSREISDSNSSATSLPISASESDGGVVRRSAYHAHSNQSRKPLPALPEHPSPDRLSPGEET